MAKAKASQDPNQNLPTLSDEEREIPEIQSAGAALLEVRTRRLAALKEEKGAEGTLIGIMKKHDREHYSFKGLEVSLEDGKTKAKVKHVPSDGDEE